MAAMLNGATIMDAALLIIGKIIDLKEILIHLKILAANEFCPQPQTYEHLTAIDIMNLKSLLILQNKIDLVSQSKAAEQYTQIRSFIQSELFSFDF